VFKTYINSVHIYARIYIFFRNFSLVLNLSELQLRDRLKIHLVHRIAGVQQLQFCCHSYLAQAKKHIHPQVLSNQQQITL